MATCQVRSSIALQTREKDLVRLSGQLWGKAPRALMGNGPAKVKAYVGVLQAGKTGYSFTSNTPPSSRSRHMGRPVAYWNEDGKGVFDVEGKPDFVGIEVQIVQD